VTLDYLDTPASNIAATVPPAASARRTICGPFHKNLGIEKTAGGPCEPAAVVIPLLFLYWLARFAMAALICAATASMVKLEPFCIGGNSIADSARTFTASWTCTKRQN
jgi:hypothetical protein